jgi:polar amino acid transport system substrate-binding protein
MTEERKESVLFSPPYAQNAYVVTVNNASEIHSFSDLAGKRAGVRSGSLAVDAIDNAQEFEELLREVVEYDDLSAAFEALEAGAVDAVVADRVSANYSVGRAGMPFRILSENLGNEEFGIAFRKSDAALEQEVWGVLESMITDVVFAQISSVWYIEDISSIRKQNYKSVFIKEIS